MKNKGISDFVASTMNGILNSYQHKSLFNTQYKTAAKKNKKNTDSDNCMLDDHDHVNDSDNCMVDDSMSNESMDNMDDPMDESMDESADETMDTDGSDFEEMVDICDKDGNVIATVQKKYHQDVIDCLPEDLGACLSEGVSLEKEDDEDMSDEEMSDEDMEEDMSVTASLRRRKYATEEYESEDEDEYDDYDMSEREIIELFNELFPGKPNSYKRSEFKRIMRGDTARSEFSSGLTKDEIKSEISHLKTLLKKARTLDEKKMELEMFFNKIRNEVGYTARPSEYSKYETSLSSRTNIPYGRKGEGLDMERPDIEELIGTEEDAYYPPFKHEAFNKAIKSLLTASAELDKINMSNSSAVSLKLASVVNQTKKMLNNRK